MLSTELQALAREFEEKTGHLSCCVEDMPEALSGNEGVRVRCETCGAQVEKPFDNGDAENLWSSIYCGVSLSVRNALARMKEIPCTGNGTPDGSPFDWSKIWF